MSRGSIAYKDNLRRGMRFLKTITEDDIKDLKPLGESKYKITAEDPFLAILTVLSCVSLISVRRRALERPCTTEEVRREGGERREGCEERLPWREGRVRDKGEEKVGCPSLSKKVSGSKCKKVKGKIVCNGLR